ncbi:hypothetical protein SAMN05421738_1271 [Algoriella xinjiangensis]|uniref:DUF7674 domain-containing protein n=1 Tax=Algoriella xinjiangensis TaxID=684065 RepID=A0A1I5BBU6_9FLAO|nr:hypothetical protein [Algoriella xinjiangensis]SFN72147.1 hypothetical protein SAMN05421738_1271 [Algoriella xinjiangensis]
MKNNNWTNLVDGKMNPNEYYSEMITEFPILKNEIENEEPEMVHFRMEIFSSYNIEQIKTKKHSELKRCFEFQESRIEKLNHELINAMNVSYCESLLLGECAKEMADIKELMTPKLKRFYEEYGKYYEELTKS